MFFYSESDSDVSQISGGSTDPYFSNVSLLLSMDSDFSDSSIHQHTTTTGGNVAVSNSEFKYGGGSGYFDGVSSTGLSVPASGQLNLSNVDWTIEAWIRPNGNYSTYNEMFHNGADWDFWLAPTTGQITFYSPSGQVSTGVAPQVNQWSHIAAVRSGGTVTIYLDGTSIGSATINLSYSGNPLGIGNVASLNNYPFAGHIDDVRITKGVARYTSNFTPPTEAHPTQGEAAQPGTTDPYFSNVVLLMPMSTDFGDSSSHNHTVNAVGDTAIVDSSGDFDGSGDYLTVSSPELAISANQAVTIEFDLRFDSRSTAGAALFDYGTHNSADDLTFLCQTNINGWQITPWMPNVYNWDGSTMVDGSWHHVAFTRTSDGSWYSFVDGSIVQSGTGATGAIASNGVLRINGLQNYGGYEFNGGMKNFRITKGTARYTANFTPPTEAHPTN